MELSNINKAWHRDDDNYYRIIFPKSITVENIVSLMSDVIQDYMEHKDSIENFYVLVDASNVESYNDTAFSIATAKAQEYLNGKIAIYNLSNKYKDLITELYKTHKSLPGIKYFNNEYDAKKWLKEGVKTSELNLQPN